MIIDGAKKRTKSLHYVHWVLAHSEPVLPQLNSYEQVCFECYISMLLLIQFLLILHWWWSMENLNKTQTLKGIADSEPLASGAWGYYDCWLKFFKEDCYKSYIFKLLLVQTSPNSQVYQVYYKDLDAESVIGFRCHRRFNYPGIQSSC